MRVKSLRGAAAGFVPVAVAAAGLLLIAAGTGSSADTAPPSAYFSLGDSLAFGEGAADPAEEGFAALVFDALQPGDGSAAPGDFVNFGVTGGETSQMMVNGQLAEAVEEIAARRATPSRTDDVQYITISIGGNDFFDLLEVCQTATLPLNPESACAEALFETFTRFQANLQTILSQVGAAAGPDAKVAVLTYYNSLPACHLAELAPLAELALEGDGGSVPGLNNLIRSIATANNVAVTEGYGLLQAGDLVGGTDCLHPKNAGHEKLAEAFLAALAD